MEQAINCKFYSQVTHFPKETPSKRAAKGTACGKAILVGEHAVVYGAKAVAIPVLSMSLDIELNPFLADGGTSDIASPIQGLLSDAFRCLGVEPYSLSLSGRSSILIGAGLGSSAALSLAVLRAVSSAFHIKMTKDDLAIMGRELEKRFHGRPSGLDTSVVAYEKPVLFSNGIVHRTLLNSRLQPFVFALIDSGVRASTLSMIEIAEPYFRTQKEILKDFDAVAEDAASAFEAGDEEALAQAMEWGGDLLKGAKVVTPLLMEMIKDAYKAGVLAAKVTGAGGGGFILCILPRDDEGRILGQLYEKFTKRHVKSLQV